MKRASDMGVSGPSRQAGHSDSEPSPPEAASLLTQTGLGQRSAAEGSRTAGRTAVLPSQGTSSKRQLSPQAESGVDKRHAPDRELDSLVAMHLARRRLCDSIQNAGTHFDANQVVDVMLEEDRGQRTAKVKLLGEQVSFAFLSEEQGGLADAYHDAHSGLPERTALLDQQLASRLQASSGPEHARLELACRQELVHVDSQLSGALVQLASLCPWNLHSGLTGNLSQPSDLPSPMRVRWMHGVFKLHYAQAGATILEAERGPRTDQAIRCMAMQQRQTILKGALALDEARAAARDALNRSHPNLPADTDIVAFDASTGMLEIAVGGGQERLRLDHHGLAAAAGEASLAFLNCKAAHESDMTAARDALETFRPLQTCFRIKPRVAALLQQRDEHGSAYTAQSLFQELSPLPAGAAKRDGITYARTCRLIAEFDEYLGGIGMSLSLALSRPAAFASHREAFLRSSRSTNRVTHVDSQTLAVEKSVLNKFRNLAIEMPIRELILQQDESEPYARSADFGAVDEFFDGNCVAPTYLAFLADTELACHAVRTYLDMTGSVDRSKVRHMKHAMHRMLCRTHPDKFPHPLEEQLSALARAEGYPQGTRRQFRLTAEMIGVYLVEHRIDNAAYRQQPRHYRPAIESALENFVDASMLKMTLDLVGRNIQAGPVQALPVQALPVPVPSTVPESAGPSVTSDAPAKKAFTVIYYRNLGKTDPNWRGAVMEVSGTRIPEATFSHPEADPTQPGEQALAVKTIHVNKQIGGAGHWSIFAECMPGSQMIKLDSVEKGYRIYVGARRDTGCVTESFDVSAPEGMTVKDVYDSMSKVAGGIGAWSDNEQGNCRGFVNSMMAELKPRLSHAITPDVRQRKQPQRYDPVKGF